MFMFPYLTEDNTFNGGFMAAQIQESEFLFSIELIFWPGKEGACIE